MLFIYIKRGVCLYLRPHPKPRIYGPIQGFPFILSKGVGGNGPPLRGCKILSKKQKFQDFEILKFATICFTVLALATKFSQALP